MSSPSSGLTATLLMFVPLLAVPFLAAFGLSLPVKSMQADATADAPPLAPPPVELNVGESLRHPPVDLLASLDSPTETTLTTPAVPAAHQHTGSAEAHVPGGREWVNPFETLSNQRPQSQAGTREVRLAENTAAPGSIDNDRLPSGFPEATAFPGDKLPSQPDRFADRTRDVTPDANAFETPPELTDDTNRPPSAAMPRNPFDAANGPGVVGNPPARVQANPTGEVRRQPGFSNEPNPAQPFAADPPGNFDAGRTLFDSGQAGRNENREPVDVAGSPAAGRARVQNPGISVRANNDPRSTAPRTLSEARQRLQQLGIRDFTLAPGGAGDAWHFSCLDTSPTNPRVKRRFEADAAEPLAAILDGLQQIENWRNGN